MAKTLSLQHMELMKFQNSLSGTDKKTNALATATLSAQGAGTRMRIVKVDASYSDSTVTGLLQIKSGAAVIREKYIHGAGAIDVGDMGLPANALNEAITVELAAGGAAVVGTVDAQGFWHQEQTN